jgi:hypothetical protein
MGSDWEGPCRYHDLCPKTSLMKGASAHQELDLLGFESIMSSLYVCSSHLFGPKSLPSRTFSLCTL